MRIYVAHNFAARSWLPKVVAQIEQLGHFCTSTWIFDDAHSKTGQQVDSAQVDINDINRSDAFVLFVDQDGPKPGKGKYFELGYAYAQGLRLFLVGEDRGCVFYHLPGIQQVRDLSELLPLLGRAE